MCCLNWSGINIVIIVVFFTSFIFIGLKLWKVGSRKIFAVKQNSTALTSQEHRSDEDDDDDDFYYGPPTKQSKTSQAAIFKELKGLKKDIRQLTKMMPLPLGFCDQIIGAFICSICHEVPAKPPVVNHALMLM